MSRFPWFPVNAAELIARTGHLSPTEFGAYWAIICALWGTDDCTMPLDARRLRMRARVHPNKWKRVWDAIAPMFDIEGNIVTSNELRERHRALAAGAMVAQITGQRGGQTTAARTVLAKGHYPNLKNQKQRENRFHGAPNRGLLSPAKNAVESMKPIEGSPEGFSKESSE